MSFPGVSWGSPSHHAVQYTNDLNLDDLGGTPTSGNLNIYIFAYIDIHLDIHIDIHIDIHMNMEQEQEQDRSFIEYIII